MTIKVALSILLLATTATACASTSNRDYDRSYRNDNTYKTQAYLDCERRDNKNQVIGAVAGAVIGGVIGNEIDKGEGKYIGAGAGAIAGAKIGDKICDKYNDPRYDDARYTNRRSFGDDRDYTVNGVTYYSERDVNFAIDRLRNEDDRLEDDIRRTSSRFERDRMESRREDIRRELRDLDQVEDRFERYNR